MRLSDAGLRRRQTKLLYPNHRPLLGLPKLRPRDRSSRLLGITTEVGPTRHAVNSQLRTRQVSPSRDQHTKFGPPPKEPAGK